MCLLQLLQLSVLDITVNRVSHFHSAVSQVLLGHRARVIQPSTGDRVVQEREKKSMGRKTYPPPPSPRDIVVLSPTQCCVKDLYKRCNQPIQRGCNSKIPGAGGSVERNCSTFNLFLTPPSSDEQTRSAVCRQTTSLHKQDIRRPSFLTKCPPRKKYTATKEYLLRCRNTGW